ncbi:MAG: hypothetical protein ACI4KF_12850 [Huintestinicola sp.]
MEIILAVIMVIFAAAMIIDGISEMKRAEKCRPKTVIVVPVSAETSDAELLLREAQKAAGEISGGCRVVICDMGADDDTLEVCRKFAEESGVFELKTGGSSEDVILEICS